VRASDTKRFPCPRCGEPIGGGDGDPYRAVVTSKHWCGGCAVFVFAEAKRVALRLALAQSRRLRTVEHRCPKCSRRLTRWLVSHRDRMLELEACSDCGVVVLDSDELEPAAALLAAALPAVMEL